MKENFINITDKGWKKYCFKDARLNKKSGGLSEVLEKEILKTEESFGKKVEKTEELLGKK